LWTRFYGERAHVGHPYLSSTPHPQPLSHAGERGVREKRIRSPFSRATKAKHPLSSPLFVGGNEGGPEKGLGDEGEM